MNNSSHNHLRRMVYAAMFGALTALGALIIIPLQPVPISLQTFFTTLSGALLGGYAGALSQIIYLLLGFIGLPVFAGGKAGLGVLFGPTGGYLIGFVLAAYVIGKITEARQESSLARIVLALIIGHLVINICGTLGLYLVAHLSLAKALLLGTVPFLFGDILKLIAVALLANKLRSHFKL